VGAAHRVFDDHNCVELAKERLELERAHCGEFNAESPTALAAALTAVFERVIALGFALHGVVVLTALVHAYPVSLCAGVEAGISFADLCRGREDAEPKQTRDQETEHPAVVAMALHTSLLLYAAAIS
jgi:hypothetical protein